MLPAVQRHTPRRPRSARGPSRRLRLPGLSAERGARPSHRNGRELGALACFGVLLVAAPQCLGGVRPGLAVGIACGAWLSLAAACWALPERARRLSWRLWAVGLLWLWTGLAAVPLPCAWVGWLHPLAAQAAATAGEGVGLGEPSWCALSVDPGNTRLELLKWGAILSVVLNSVLLVRALGRQSVLRCVGLSTAVMTLVALAHWAAGAERVYGIYTPRQLRGQSLLAPLLNLNHLGGFLLLGLAVQIALGRVTRNASERMAWYGAAALSAATTVLTLSRGALGGLLLLGLVIGAGVWLQRRPQGSGGRTTGLMWPLFMALAVGLALGVHAVAEPLLAELRRGDIHKVELFAAAWPLVLRQPVLGLGRGAFSAVFAGVHPAAQRYTHPENILLQWTSEWGLPVALAALTLLGLRIVRALRPTGADRDALGLRRMAAASLLAYGFQNCFDYGAELVACGCVAAAVVGALESRSRGSEPTASEPVTAGGLRRAMPALWLGVTGCALAGLGVQTVRFSVPAVCATLQNPHVDVKRAWSALVTGVRLHPLEPAIPYSGAAWALAKAPHRTAPLIKDAQALAPGWAGPYALDARWLWRQGEARKAAVALREAAVRDAPVAADLACALVKQRPDLVGTVLPPVGAARDVLLGSVAQCVPPASAEQRTLDLELMERFPDEQAAFIRETQRLQAAGAERAAERLLKRALASRPDKSQLWVLRLEGLLARRQLAEATRVLEQAEGALGPSAELLRIGVQLAGLRGDEAALKRRFAALRAKVSGDPARLADAYWIMGHMHVQLGHPAQALHAFADAYSISGMGQAAVDAALLVEGQGNRVQAQHWWQQACAALPEHPRACTSSQGAGAGRK